MVIRFTPKGLSVSACVPAISSARRGGSIAHRSDLGTLNVGPESSGAQPGPACYGRGGTEATVTDADLTLGYLNADFFLGGAMKIDAVATNAAFGKLAGATQLAELGELETPIVLTNTLAVGRAVEALVDWTLARTPDATLQPLDDTGWSVLDGRVCPQFG